MDGTILFYIIFTVITYVSLAAYVIYDFWKSFNNSKIVFLRKDKSFYRFISAVLVKPSKIEYLSKSGKFYPIPKTTSYINKYGKPVYLIDIETKELIPFTIFESKDGSFLNALDDVVETKFIKGFAKALVTKQDADKMMIIVILVCGYLGGFITGVFLPVLIPEMFGG